MKLLYCVLALICFVLSVKAFEMRRPSSFLYSLIGAATKRSLENAEFDTTLPYKTPYSEFSPLTYSDFDFNQNKNPFLQYQADARMFNPEFSRRKLQPRAIERKQEIAEIAPEVAERIMELSFILESKPEKNIAIYLEKLIEFLQKLLSQMQNWVWM